MDTEHYIPEEAQSFAPAQPAQEAPARAETAEPLSSEQSRFHYRFDELLGDDTDELKKALARLQEERAAQKRRDIDITDIMSLGIAIYKISLELLMRSNPAVRDLATTLTESGLRKIEAQKQWEQDILATEGEEGLKRRKQLGEGPINQNTPEELEMYVRNVQLQVDAGLLKPSDLTFAMEVRDAGGFYQWDKERDRKNSEAYVRELIANGHDPSQVIANIQRLSTDEYGEEYAQRQHEILAELAGIAAQKAAPISPETTTR